MTKVLTFENISYWYKTKDESILNDINYDFEAGVFYTVVGSSGSGKTTFLSLAGGLDTQKEGDIYYKGSSLKSIGLQQFRNKYVSIVFQSYNLLTYMTALQNVTTAMEITHVNQPDKKGLCTEYARKSGHHRRNGAAKSIDVKWWATTTGFDCSSPLLRNRIDCSR